MLLIPAYLMLFDLVLRGFADAAPLYASRQHLSSLPTIAVFLG